MQCCIFFLLLLSGSPASEHGVKQTGETFCLDDLTNLLQMYSAVVEPIVFSPT